MIKAASVVVYSMDRGSTPNRMVVEFIGRPHELKEVRTALVASMTGEEDSEITVTIKTMPIREALANTMCRKEALEREAE